MLPPGTSVCWKTQLHSRGLRGKIVAHISPGTSPAQAAPELLGLQWNQVKFTDPKRPRIRACYLIRREERSDHGTERITYYLPPVRVVQPVCDLRNKP